MKVEMMDSALREEVKGDLVAALGEGKVLWKPVDLLPYAADSSRMRPEEVLKHPPDLVVGYSFASNWQPYALSPA